MATTEKALQTLGELADLFKRPDELVDTLAVTAIVGDDDRPLNRWSWGNRMLCAMYGTSDARTFNQWREVGRFVKAGARSFCLLAPNTKIVEEKAKPGEGEGRERTIITGFRCFPVFTVDDTEGEPLPDYKPMQLPPFMEVAESWGINVSWRPQGGALWWGTFGKHSQTITLLTHAESTWFHELVRGCQGNCGMERRAGSRSRDGSGTRGGSLGAAPRGAD